MSLGSDPSIEMRLVLSSDGKPRLKWTQELHNRFIDAVSQLGGVEKATPKSLVRVMGIRGLTLYHLKSHLQKYRLGKSQKPENYQKIKQEDHGETRGNDHSIVSKICDGAHQQITESLQIAQALQMQMEVQRKLQEQIEVQRHLQLRIEAQGKYLQSVLQKAHTALSGRGSCSIEVEQAKAQLSELASMVDSASPSSLISLLNQSEGSQPINVSKKQEKSHLCSFESSLTSSGSSENMGETRMSHGFGKYRVKNNLRTCTRRSSFELSLMDMHPSEERNKIEIKSNHDENPFLDLNLKSSNETDSVPRVLDLGCNGRDVLCLF